MQFLRRIQELHNQRNLVPPLKELHSKELIGEHVSNQLGHSEVTRTKVSQHLIPLHPSDRQQSYSLPSPALLPERRDTEEEGDEMSGDREEWGSREEHFGGTAHGKWSCATVKIFVAAAAC